MSGFVKKVLDKFKAEKGNGTDYEERLTNKVLLDELISHFKSVLKTESIGQRMLYPMSFNILMDPMDYNERLQYLPFVLPEVVSGFYGIIEDMRGQYPNYTPPAKYWFFQFSACRVEEVQALSSGPLIVRRGHLTTVATLMTFDIRNASHVSVDTSTRVSIKLDDSKVMGDVNVNWNAIRNLDVISDGVYTYNFDDSLNRDSKHIIQSSNFGEINGLAELSYSKDGYNYQFVMKDNLVHISGSNETRSGRQFFIVKSPNIKDSHVQIKYLPSEAKFQIAAYGPVRLNSRKLDESSGGDIFWYYLADNSRIFINDEVSVKFEIRRYNG